MDNQDIKPGDIVVYCDGLFRVSEMVCGMGLIKIGQLLVPPSQVRKADWRDEVRILKGGKQ